jgi:hypothetical protein
MIEGASLIVNGSGQQMSSPTSVSFNGPFSNTATTFAFGGQTFRATYAAIDTQGVTHALARFHLKCGKRSAFCQTGGAEVRCFLVKCREAEEGSVRLPFLMRVS